MIDPKILRENPELLKQSQKRRGVAPETVDHLIELDERHRQALNNFEILRSEQKSASKEIGKLRGSLKRLEGEEAAAAEAAVTEQLAHTAELAQRVKAAEAAANELGSELATAWDAIDNVVDPDAPVGTEEDFTVIATHGEPRDFASEGFTPKDHLELGTELKAIDVPSAAKVSGSRFYYLTGDGALLEFALLQLALSLGTSHQLIPTIPPALVNEAAMAGTGFLGQAAENVYHLAADDLYLVGTSEVALAAKHSDEILDREQLPLRYLGFSPCFRREAGAHGRDTHGIIRVHQFDKVEMFSFVEPQDAVAEHHQLLRWEQEFMDLLEIPYRVIDVATGDLGASATRKFDIEAWIPTQGKYREVTSTSNCTTYQARRLKIRYRAENGKPTPVATLNGTLVAMPRVIVALLENHQLADGRVAIPKALQPFLGNRVYLQPPV